jgi:hypothetical protein
MFTYSAGHSVFVDMRPKALVGGLSLQWSLVPLQRTSSFLNFIVYPNPSTSVRLLLKMSVVQMFVVW